MKRMEEKNIFNRYKLTYGFKIVVVETNKKLEENKKDKTISRV